MYDMQNSDISLYMYLKTGFLESMYVIEQSDPHRSI